MGRMTHRTGKQTLLKTAIKGKRYLCARCRKRSPKPVKTPAPWYCPKCLNREKEDSLDECQVDLEHPFPAEHTVEYA